MSIHPSLNLSEKDKKQRSVLKRSERIKHMMEKGEWKKGDKIFGLPKIKTLRLKFKKEKAEKPAEAEAVAAEGAAAPSETEVKEQAATKKEVTEKTQKAQKSQEKK